ncbi:MAG: flagellar motor protein MotD [Pseudomonadota bacterium]|uniref:flagellar motor protein MotD n=1 Tax=Methylophaga aminisulfidivorans TaxID=230105 RepID=UPI0024E22059|nr:flagellar motor protein MotD [Methylophaga aminisulfidivorans]MEC9412904.1 flagellar motor protein MotD [Pseudomonadota bacterium]
MARRNRHEEHENHERWLVSYADFITLLFAFFVVMYSISSVNEGKYRVLSDTLEAVFSEPVRSKDPIQIGEISRGKGEIVIEPLAPVVPETPLPEVVSTFPPKATDNDIRTINDLSKQFSSALSDWIKSDDVMIKQGEDWLELEIKSRVLFESGEARLARPAIPVLGEIASILQKSANPIQVEGFTDNNPINTPRFPSNWELSAARAASVVHLLDRYGIQPDRMSAIGYGEYKPIASNDTEAGRQKNRRVVLVVLGNDMSRRDINVFHDASTGSPSSRSSIPVNSDTSQSGQNNTGEQ